MVMNSGRAVGRFLVGVADGSDVGDEPDAIPASGTVTFTGAVPYVPVLGGGEGPVTLLTSVVKGVLDSEGYLCAPDPADPSVAGARGLRLFASDDPDALTQGWTWTVTYKFDPVGGIPPAIPPHSMVVLSGATMDLTTLVKVPASPGLGVEQAVALVARAEAAVTETRVAPPSPWTSGSYIPLVSHGNLTSTVTYGVGLMKMWPIYIPKASVWSEVAMWVATANTAVVKVALYSGNGTDFSMSRVHYFGSYTCSATGLKTLTGAWSVPAGWYWIAIQAETAGAVLNAPASATRPPVFSLPSGIGTHSASAQGLDTTGPPDATETIPNDAFWTAEANRPPLFSLKLQ